MEQSLLDEKNRKRVKNALFGVVLERKGTLVVTFLCAYFVTLAVVSAIPGKTAYAAYGFRTPDEAVLTTVEALIEEPRHIEITSIGVNSAIRNPFSRDIEVLDEELKKGVARYPGSARLGDQGNMFIFGHSSSLPVIHNQAYKAFNRLGKLKSGDEIVVYSDTKKYTYRVKDVSLVNDHEESVAFNTGVKMLTLATCNVLGEKQERFVVRADFVKSELLEVLSADTN
ncbi:MAG: hypothetical protein A2928_00805 [Candidatus Taylorbacteria bacterium RIFCSPLOWO2_01_FULL_45_15b]|uniref:Sortase n=1 Tax=Candidatus Taylorbacteria bacterium RIFCSPLOWO2_01_FULL_45_15b TaxID=1802319 RepID=A0A1G2NAJ5_9BACT|nr:MAG: hypothetical protein A2928_00805 [Candidatus Taylorbacteria bacterium RIFCSPLOWO2_01_FULL_45_15b]